MDGFHKVGNVYMKWVIWWMAALLFLFAPGPSWARGGGGCLAEGTRVLTPQGAVAIENLKKGDTVWTLIEGKIQRAEIQGLIKVEPEEYLEVSAGGARLQVTPEHPMMVARGEYRLAGRIQVGDTVYLMHNGKLEEASVRSIRRIPAKRPAYNLLVFPGGTFITEKFVLHNKGCFLPDSQILKSDGRESPIHAIRQGDEVLAFTPEGRMVRTKVREVILHEADEYILLKTDRATLRVTKEHPFYVGRGTFKTVEALKEGDPVFAWDGQWLTEQQIISLERVRAQVQVFNLQTDHPNTFFAGQIAVHNKGGCFPAGTRIATPKGSIAIESLASGDEVLAVTGNGLTVRSTVKTVFVGRDILVRTKTSGGDLVATAEHPVSLQGGVFKQVRDLLPGDRIVKWKKGRLTAKTVRSLLFTGDEALVFDLQVGEPHTYVAEEIVVHNKGGGCFPTGTPIRTPQGQTLIEKLSPGDSVLAIDPEGRMIQTRVDKIFAARSLVLSVDTDHGLLHTTMDHPLGLPGGDFVPAGQLRPGQKLLVWKDGGVCSTTVLRTTLEGREREVYNLSAGWPNTFLAADFLTHNKGGSSSRSSSSSSRSGSGSSSSSSSGDDSIFGFIAAVGAISVFALILFIWGRAKSQEKKENLDFVYDRNKISPKASKTEKLLAFLSQQDPSVSPEDLRKLTESTFRKLQECWQARDYSPMQPLLMADLFGQHTAQLEGLARNHEINRIESLKVEQVDLVNVRYTEKPDQREFTALITASAQDYYVDDRTEKFLRGDRAPARFQEFWTFHRLGDRWLVREIEQTGESDILKDENLVEMLTDDTLRGIYGEVAEQKGEAGPWLEKETGKKATRIERMLNFLVQTDKLWNRNQMLDRAREMFLSVYLTRESGDPGRVPVADLFPAIAESLRAQIRQWQEQGLKVEYRNLCVRKAELILVRNFSDRAKDEFTARISAHAQRIIHKGDQLRSEQQYVTPFEEYWTFGRLDNQWKLKEVLPPALGKKKLAEENVDEDSSQSQLQWYYRQTRAR
jgi:predicted lipid-binding transport protein (Tim44 family)/3-dehydroquinate synthase class II